MDAKFWAAVLLCCLPLKDLRLNSAYGLRFHPLLHNWKKHAGVDLAARGDTVYAIMDGTVSCRYGPQLGLSVRIDHRSGLTSTYGHLSQWLVLPGDTVKMADAIGVTGATGRVTGELKEDDPLSDTTVRVKPPFTAALDHIYRLSLRKHPDVTRLILQVPDEAKAPYQAMSFFGDGTIIYNHATEFYDQGTLKPLPYVDPDDKPYGEIGTGEKVYRMNFDFHTGQILGLPTKILAFLACMIGASLPVTGTIIWYNRKWGKKKKKPQAV